MFYSSTLLAKSGPLAHVWLAATWDKKLTKAQVVSTSIVAAVDAILSPSTPLALRLCAKLLLGVARIYARKAAYFASDCAEAMVRIRMAFRPGAVELPAEMATAAKATITVATFDDVDPSFDQLESPLLIKKASNKKKKRKRNDPQDDDDEDWVTAQAAAIGIDIDIPEAVRSRQSTDSSIELRRDRDDDASFEDPMADLDPIQPDDESMARTSLRRASMLSDAGLPPPPSRTEGEASPPARPEDDHQAQPHPPLDDAPPPPPPLFDDEDAPPPPPPVQDDEVPPPPSPEDDEEMPRAQEAPQDAEEATSVVREVAEATAKKPRKRQKKLFVDANPQLESSTIKEWLADTSAIVTDQVQIEPKHIQATDTNDPLADLSDDMLNQLGKRRLIVDSTEPEKRSRSSISSNDTPEIARFRHSSSAPSDASPVAHDILRHHPGDDIVQPPTPPLPDFLPPPPPPIDDLPPPPPSLETPPDPVVREWHPNTIKVAAFLKDNIDREGSSFDQITAGFDKKTTVGIFVELLHLHSWNFVQLRQSATATPIRVVPDTNFNDPIPDVPSGDE